jgi:hypothetical protein
MNASDIVKAKQNKTLYKAYYHPTVFQSSIFSTIYSISSVGEKIVASTSFGSCITTVYNYVCNPTFLSYQMANSVNDGTYECGLKKISELQWKNTTSTTIYEYSTTIGNTSSATSSITGIYTTSSIINMGPQPLICPLINMSQGTNYLNRCNKCNSFLMSQGYCCDQCM